MKEGNSVLTKDYTTDVWDSRNTRGYGNFPGKIQVEIVESAGKLEVVHILDVKYMLPVDRILAKLPDHKSFGRQSKLRVDLKLIPNLKWELTVTVETSFTSVTSKLDSSTSNTARSSTYHLGSITVTYNLHPFTKLDYICT